MADVAQLQLRVYSGRHTATDIRELSPAEAIASVLLTPRAGYEKGFAYNIERSHSRIRQAVRSMFLVTRLRALLSHADTSIRDRACVTLSRWYPYRDPCLIDARRSDDEEILSQIKGLESESGKRLRILRMLRDDPLGLSISGQVADLVDDLEIVAFDSDPEVQRRARGAVRCLLGLSDSR